MRRNFALLLLLPLAACAPSIRQIGPDTYQLHQTIRNAGQPGTRAALVQKAQNKCARQHQAYTQLREEMGFASGLTYTLTFRCTGQGA